MQSPFNILNSNQPNSEIEPSTVTGTLNERIQKVLTTDKIVLFMKGNEVAPQCGFSANTIRILKSCEKSFKTFDILKDGDIRQGLKDFSNWPTYPQLYVD